MNIIAPKSAYSIQKVRYPGYFKISTRFRKNNDSDFSLHSKVSRLKFLPSKWGDINSSLVLENIL